MTNRITMPSEVTPELAYLCGVIAGDGCITYRERKNEWCVEIGGNPADEKEFYDDTIKTAFESVFGILLSPKYLSSHQTYGFRIYSKQLALYLTECLGLPVGKKYEKLAIPTIFLHSSVLSLAFIRGVFDTDGCISFKKRNKGIPYYPVISFSTKSQRFAYSIAYHLTKEGFLPFVTVRCMPDKRPGFGTLFVTDVQLNGIMNFDIWQSQVGFANPKHLKKIKSWQAAGKALNMRYRRKKNPE